MTTPGRIDVHAHHLPEPYRDLLARSGHAQPDGMPEIPEWSAADHVPAGSLARSLRANTLALFPNLPT